MFCSNLRIRDIFHSKVVSHHEKAQQKLKFTHQMFDIIFESFPRSKCFCSLIFSYPLFSPLVTATIVWKRFICFIIFFNSTCQQMLHCPPLCYRKGEWDVGLWGPAELWAHRMKWGPSLWWSLPCWSGRDYKPSPLGKDGETSLHIITLINLGTESCGWAEVGIFWNDVTHAFKRPNTVKTPLPTNVS